MSKTDQEMTEDYCRNVINDLRELEELLTGSLDGETDKELFREMADNAGESYDDYQVSVIDWVNLQLEFKALGERGNDGEWSFTGTKTLVGFGGPNVWVTTKDGSDYVIVEVYWGSSEAGENLYAPNLASQLNELGEL